MFVKAESNCEYPLVSIVCVVKNGVSSIRRAIDSILAQDYPNIEIIVQDGVSTDGSLEILQGYGDKIKLVSEPDSNGAEGLSRVLSRIKGRFWGSCLADEEMLPDAVSWGVKNLQDNPDLGAVYGDSYATDIEGNIVNEVVADDFDLTKLICVEVVPPFAAAFFRTSHFRQIQLSEPLENNADYEIWFKLGMKFPIMHIKKTVTKCSWHTGSDSCQAKTYPLQVQSKKRIMKGIFSDPSTPDEIKSLYFRAYSGLLLWASNSLLGNYNRGYDTTEQTLDLAAEYYLESLKYKPDQAMLKMIASKLYKIGVMFYKKGELEKAQEYVELSLKTDLCLPGFNYTHAVILYSLGRFGESEDAAEAELKIKHANQKATNLSQRLLPEPRVFSNGSSADNADIKDERALIEHILHENPHLKSCLKQRKVVEAALIIRGWVSRNINISLGYMLFDPKDPVSSYNIFNKKKGAVWCGGASKFYAMIMRLFGIPAATFGYSVDGVEGLSHSTTLICDITKHNMPIYLIDAYLNYYFVDTNSRDVLEFCELIKRIRLKQYDSIRLVELKVSRPQLAKPGNTECSMWMFPGDQRMNIVEKRNDVWVFGPASPKLTTWIPICWPDKLGQLLDGRSLDQFLLDMMLCNPTYGNFGKDIINKALADKIALANHVSVEDPVRISDEGSVMKLRKYNIKQSHNTKPPQPQGWKQFWHGYYQMTKVCSEKKRKDNAQRHSVVDLPSDVLGEGEFEKTLFLNIIDSIDKDHVNMFELGAGRGDWCLSLAGVVDFQLIPQRAKTYRCLALEGEPTHFQWTKEHFDYQHINGTVVHGAIQSYNGVCKFNARPNPADCYGQGVRENGNITIPCFTIDRLMADHSFNHVDIIHMDVQNAEYEALLGASSAIENGAIDYILLETHTKDMNQKIKDLMGDRYNCIVDIPRDSPLVDTPLGKASLPVGGIMLLQRKGIETLSSKAIDADQEDIVGHTKFDITDIEKDALVVVIDIHDNMVNDNAKTLPGWEGYYEQNIRNLCSLLEYCNAHDIKIQKVLYRKDRNRNSRLKHIRFDHTSEDKLDYSKFSHIYFCGISIDQCVVRRPLGYFNLKHPRKTLLKNCSFQGLKYIGPIDYGITKQPGAEMGKFESMEELHKHVDEFLGINKINTRNWTSEKKQQIFQSWIDSMAQAKGRVYYRDQTVQSLSFLTELAHKHKPTKIIELGTATGISLRAWISATTDAEIVAVDLSFKGLYSNEDAIPLDLSRVKLIEGDILKTDFTPLWKQNDRVLFFIDAHDLDDVPIMNYILQNVVNSLPQGSIVVIDDLWYSSETITGSNDQKVFQWITSEEVDPLQCFEGNYAPYWQGGVFVGFKEVIPLMEWVNRNKIQLHFEHKGKVVAFECNQNITNDATDDFDIEVFNSMTGKSLYNPLDKVLVPDNNDPADQKAKVLCQLAKELFAKNEINDSLQLLMDAISLSKNIRHGSYAIAVCQARLTQFDIALKALQLELNSAYPHPNAQKLLADINGYLSRNKKGQKQSLPVDEIKSFTKKEKYLSVVVTSRNDDHGGNTLHRTQVFARGFAEQCRRFGLDAELIFVEWNPPADRKRLYEVIDWPDDLGPLTVRFIEVPPEIHNTIGNADKFPLFQMIAKNIGIRRARGKFVLATNIDILLNDELMQFLASKQLDENSCYRIDRHDTYNQTIPTDVDISEQLEFCKNTLVRVQGLYGTKKISEMETDHFKYSDKDTKLHTNACGDFMLMSRQMWHAFRAYPELGLWSIFVDGLLMHMAYVAKMRQVILPEPMRIYHIEHETGWKVISETIKQRPSLDRKKQYEPWCQRMIDQGQPITNNDENWGYAQSDFKEQVISGKWQGHAFNGSTSKNCNEKIHSLIETFSDINSRLYYRDQSAESLQVLADVVADYKPTKIIELGTLSGISLRTWIATGTDADIIAVDLSFEPLKKSQQIAPLDLSRVMLVQQDILKTDFSQFWSKDDRVIFYVDAHDLEDVPIMPHVLSNALPTLPEGSCFIVDDLWYCPEAATNENVLGFFDKVTTSEVDSLQCFEGYCAPYWKGGFFIGFREVVELLEYVNRNRIELVFTPGDKAVMFKCSTGVTNNVNEFDIDAFKRLTGRLNYNPVAQYKLLENTTLARQTDILCKNGAELFGKGKIKDALVCFGQALENTKNISGAFYAQAVCLARLGRLDLAEKMLELEMQNGSVHPRTHILLKDIVNHRAKGRSSVDKSVQQTKGITIFTVPKAFEGHIGVIQRNAIKSWINLAPRPEIILFGNDKGTKEIAEEFGLRHIPETKCNEFGTPQIDYLFNKAQQCASNDIIAYVNADIILFNDFVDAPNSIVNKAERFLIVGQHWDLDVTEHLNFDDNKWSRRLLDRVKSQGQQHPPTGIDYFVFKKGLWPKIPPFAIGRTVWDNWLVGEALRLGAAVVDATDAVTIIHQNHGYDHLAGGKEEAWKGPEAKNNLALAGSTESMRSIAHLNIALVNGQLVNNVLRQNQKGHTCFQKGDIKGSIDAFDSLTKIEPENIIAYNNLGIAYQKNSDTSNALKNFSKAFQLDPYNRLTVLNIHRFYIQAGFHNDADRLINKYLEINPNDTEILNESLSSVKQVAKKTNLIRV